MSALVCAEQIARTAHLQIAHGDLETRAEFGELLDALQPFRSQFGECFIFAVSHVGVGGGIRAPDTSP